MAKTRPSGKMTRKDKRASVEVVVAKSIVKANKRRQGTDAPRTRSRIPKASTFIPGNAFRFGGHLLDLTDAQQRKLKKISPRPFVPCKSLHHPAMDQLQIVSEVERLFNAIGWQQYLTLNCPALRELTWEFYSTFRFGKADDFTLSTPDVVQYKLMGQSFSQSIAKFNHALGFIAEGEMATLEFTDSACDYTQAFTYQMYKLWQDWSADIKPYNSKKSKDSYLHDPILRYIHRFLSFNFSGRKDSSGVLNKAEFFFLWCMRNNVRVNFGFWIASQFQAVATTTNKPLILGSLITQLAINLGVLDLTKDTDLQVENQCEPLDIPCLIRMGIVYSVDGGYQFTPPGPALPESRRRSSTMVKRRVLAGDASSSVAPEPADSSDEDSSIHERLSRVEKELATLVRLMRAHFGHEGSPPPTSPSISD